MSNNNLETAQAFLEGRDAATSNGALRSERKLGEYPALYSYNYLLAWVGPGSGRVFINHEESGKKLFSNRKVRDAAFSNTTQRHRGALRSALFRAGYRLAPIQPEPNYERWEALPKTQEETIEWGRARGLRPWLFATDSRGHTWEVTSFPTLRDGRPQVFARREPGAAWSAEWIDAYDLVPLPLETEVARG